MPASRRRLVRRRRQVLPRVVFAQVQFLRLAAGQFRDVERRRLVALLTLHCDRATSVAPPNHRSSSFPKDSISHPPHVKARRDCRQSCPHTPFADTARRRRRLRSDYRHEIMLGSVRPRRNRSQDCPDFRGGRDVTAELSYQPRNATVPLHGERDRSVFSVQRFLRQTRFPAEKWTSPHPGCERLRPRPSCGSRRCSPHTPCAQDLAHDGNTAVAADCGRC